MTTSTAPRTVPQMSSTLLAGATPPERERAIVELATTQHGIVTGAQLEEYGIDRSAVARAVARGRLTRLHPGVFAVGQCALAQEGWWLAAVWRAGSAAVLSHRSAAALWGIARMPATGIDVTCSHYVRAWGDVTYRRRRPIAAADITERRGIPVTSLARTIVDLGQVLTAPRLADVLHEAQYHHELHPSEIRAALERAGGRLGVQSVRRAIALNEAGSAGTRSRLEDRFLGLMQTYRLPVPQLNVLFGAGADAMRVDCLWPEHHLCAEIDGAGHGRVRSQREDRVRDARLAEAGFRVVRFTGSEIYSQPRLVAEHVRRMLDMRRSG